MASLQSFAGTFTSNTSTGNQAITGVGFQPQAIIFFATAKTATGIAAEMTYAIGWAVSSTSRKAMGVRDQDGQAVTDVDTTQRSTKTLFAINPTGADGNAMTVQADFVSMDADGFTVNITTAPASGVIIGFMALGGTSMTNVATGALTCPASTGNQGTTGVGFQPDIIFLMTAEDDGTTGDSTSTGRAVSFGAAVSSSKRFAMANQSKDGSATSLTGSYFLQTKCISALFNANNLAYEADHVSMDADGFTLNFTTVDGNPRAIYYLAIKGGNYDIATVTSQTGTGNFSSTGPGFLPSGLMLVSTMRAASASIQTDYRLTVGFASASTARWASGGLSQSGQVASSNTDAFIVADRVYKNYDHAQTLNGDIDFVSFDASGFTLNQTDADPAGTEIAYVAFGPGTAAAAAVTNMSRMLLTGVGM